MAYALQRLSFFQDKEIVMQKLISSHINKSLYFYQSEIVDYIYNNFISILYNVQNKRRFAGMYRRYLTIISFLFIATYILCYKSYTISVVSFPIPLILVFIPLLIMIYSGYQTYHPLTYEEDPSNAKWVYSRKNNIIFWVIVALQIYIFWILLFKPVLIFPNTEILFDALIRITKIYTIEDKVMYIFQYFEYYLTSTGLTVEEQEMLRYKLRLMDFSNIITENTTLKDIRMNVKEFIQTEYYKNMIIIWEYLIAMATEEGPWYRFLKNLVFIGAIASTVIGTIEHYTKFWSIVQQLYDPIELSRIATKMIEGNPSKVTLYKVWEFVCNLKYELYDSVDLVLFDAIPLQIKIIFIGITAMVLSTYLVPLQKDSLIFLDDLPVVSYGTQNLFTLYFHCIGALCLVFWIIICIKVLYKRKKKSDEAIN